MSCYPSFNLNNGLVNIYTKFFKKYFNFLQIKSKIFKTNNLNLDFYSYFYFFKVYFRNRKIKSLI